MTALRLELAQGLNRPTMGLEGQGGSDRNHEMTYNWYEPGAKLGRHLDEHHEETKGPKGWQMPTRRSVTWLVYLNDGWTKEDGGILHCFSRQSRSSAPVGAHEGNLQVGWMDHVHPVFLESWREESGLSALYRLTSDKRPSVERKYVSAGDFDMPHQPIKFQTFLRQEYRQGSRFEQISTARRDPRFFDSTQPLVSSSASTENESYPVHIVNVVPAAGTLVLFDSVTLPHLVGEVTGPRQRIAATGWFHEDNQALPF
ncbi:hypothetical protein MHU86_12926 [Fragilaria crotonensis]|nr:hypothetical protein MHU86_12926 [Fragilaria crotonensis]